MASAVTEVRVGELGRASPMSQLIFQPFCRFIYVTGTSPMSPGKPPMLFCYITICNDGFIERSERVS